MVSSSRRGLSSPQGVFHLRPLAKHPEPTLPFVVEVEASDVGVGAVLSQRQRDPLKWYPCAFFSKETVPCREELRRRRLGALGGEVGIRGVETLAGGCQGTIRHPITQVLRTSRPMPCLVSTIRKRLQSREHPIIPSSLVMGPVEAMWTSARLQKGSLHPRIVLPHAFTFPQG